MKSSQVAEFFAKCLLLTSPFIFLAATYIYFDPAQVLWHYDDFNRVYMNNRDFISTQVFINNNPVQHYQSFILGNSRSGPYYTKDWAPYINDKQPYHFDASGESLYGLYSKVKFLDKNATGLKNVLIVCDRTLLRYTGNPPGGPLFMTDSRTSGKSWLEFHLGFVKAYFSDFYCFEFLKFKLTSVSASDAVWNSKRYRYEPISNDMPMWKKSLEIEKDSVGYYKKYKNEFKMPHEFPAHETNAVLGEEHVKMLREMADIFRKHHTDYRIVISPLLDKVPLHPKDVKVLETVFGANRIYNYSGVNKFTSAYQNYYESSHYRPIVARQIMREIYAQPVE